MTEVAQEHPWTCCEAEILIPPRCREVREEELDGQAILTHSVTGNAHWFNETSLAVWRCCDGRTTTRRSAQRLTELYDVDFDTALDHVEQVIAVFTESQLLESGSD